MLEQAAHELLVIKHLYKSILDHSISVSDGKVRISSDNRADDFIVVKRRKELVIRIEEDVANGRLSVIEAIKCICFICDRCRRLCIAYSA